jgi:hypothetical protein
LQPLRQPTLPAVKDETWVRNAVDRFVLAKLEAQGITPSSTVSPRVLARRLYFDLLGLPPSPEEVAEFESAVERSGELACQALVDRLLASPHHGERWARHWLDIVRYAESDGFERNQPRPNAWPYRDWVIAALNADLPYDEFVRLQIAADVLRPDDSDALRATGFLVAGIHNTVIGQNEFMREAARQDELEDSIGTLAQTFLGFTVQCARCHEHKFDPVNMPDYYRLAAALSGTGHGERKFVARKDTKLEQELRERLESLEREASQIQQKAFKLASAERRDQLSVRPLAQWKFEKDGRDEMGHLPATLKDNAKIEKGRLVLDGKSHAITSPLTKPLREKTLEAWLSLDTLDQMGGGVVTVEADAGRTFDSLVFAERQPGKWMAGSNFYLRTRNLDAPVESGHQKLIHAAVVYHANHSITFYREGVPYGETYKPVGSQLQTYSAGNARVLFGLRHTGGGRAHLSGQIEEARLYDRALTSREVADSFRAGIDAQFVTPDQLVARLTEPERNRLKELLGDIAILTAELGTRKPEPAAVNLYVVNPTAPPATHLFDRGDVRRPKEAVLPGGVAVLGSETSGLAANATNGERRRWLAQWITRPENPLLARVIVNRLWQYHFGTGIVDTPSDFGFNGGRPSHPQLLDYLATELVRQRWSLKAIHRLIVQSNTYRQASRLRAEPARIDSGNRLLWRRNPQRLEAETLRDAMLAAAGTLQRQFGGPGYHDVKTVFNNGTTYYEPLESGTSASSRRTVYRFSPRGERGNFLDSFDCPDPSVTAPKRSVTTTPMQALALLNGELILQIADRLATRAQAESPSESVKRAYLLILGRAPTPDEDRRASAFTTNHGLPSLVRVLLNTTEFVVIE